MIVIFTGIRTAVMERADQDAEKEFHTDLEKWINFDNTLEEAVDHFSNHGSRTPYKLLKLTIEEIKVGEN